MDGGGVRGVGDRLRFSEPDAEGGTRWARTLRGFDETHTGIVASPAVAAHLGEILATVP